MNKQTGHLLIFDCDGVLVDSEPLANRIFTRCLQEEGFTVDEAYCNTHFYGISLRECLEHLETAFGRGVSPTFTETLSLLTNEEIRSSLQPIIHVKEALVALKDYPKCVASGSDPERIELSLEVTGLKEHFTHLYNSYQVKRGKPDPDIFLFAAEQQGYLPEQCIVIEDSDAGVQAGLSAGMQVLLYRPILEDESSIAKGVIHFTDMRSLPELVKGLSKNGKKW